MPPESASEGHSLDSHHLQHKDNVAKVLQKMGVPPGKCLLVGSGSIAQQVREQYLNRRPGDLDFFINDPSIWELVKEIGTEVPGAIGNSVVQLKLEGWDIEFFQFLPGMPDRRVKNVFKNSQWKNGVQCMGLIDITIWKWHLSRMKNRAQYKKENDRKDMKRAMTKMIKDLFIGQLDYQSKLIAQGQMLLN